MPRITVDGRELELARRRKGWTLRDLMARTEQSGKKINFSQLARYERGEITPNPATALLLAQVLEIDVDDILTPVERVA